MIVGAGLLHFSCTEEPDELPEDPAREDPSGLVYDLDTASIETVVNHLTSYVPTWEEIERFSSVARFIAVEGFEKRAIESGPLGGDGEDHMIRVMAAFDETYEFFSANVSSALISYAPPLFDEGGDALAYPLSGDLLDEKMRSAAAMMLLEKSKDRPVWLINRYPPESTLPSFTSLDDFRSWFSGSFLPEKVAEAEMAERVFADKYIPFPVEFESFIRQIGGWGEGGFIDDMSSEQILALAREISSSVLAQVRPRYSGVIVASLYNDYSRGPSFWQDMTYEDYDEIHFGFFPYGNESEADAYVNAQMANYMRILERSGTPPWLAGEVIVFDGSSDPSLEKILYELVFDKLDEASIAPSGMSVGAGIVRTEEASSFISEYFRSH